MKKKLFTEESNTSLMKTDLLREQAQIAMSNLVNKFNAALSKKKLEYENLIDTIPSENFEPEKWADEVINTKVQIKLLTEKLKIINEEYNTLFD